MDFEDIYYTCKNLPKDIKLGKYSAKNYRAEGVSDLAHAVKSDNPDILKRLYCSSSSAYRKSRLYS